MEENRQETEIRDKRLDNLKTDAGPGRPKGQRNFATIYREALIKLAQSNNKEPDELENEMLSKALILARKGDYRFYKDVLDRLHGTPVNRNEHTGKDGKDLPVPIMNINAVPNNNSDKQDNKSE